MTICLMPGFLQVKKNLHLNLSYFIFRPEFAKRFSIDNSNGALEVWNLRLNDFGFYQCLAKNKLSEDDRRTFLVVTGMHVLKSTVVYSLFMA